MRTLTRGILAALAVFLVGTTTPAWACEMLGTLVCENNTDVVVAGRQVTFDLVAGSCDPAQRVLTSDSGGNFGTDVCWETTWNVTYFGTLTCGESGLNQLGTVLVPSTDPACGGGGGADCSPGFYKNHKAAWCPAGSEAARSGIVCQDEATYTCDRLVCLLSAEPPCKSKEPQRAFAKACLDAFSPANICSETDGASLGVTTASITASAPAATGGCNSTGGSIGWLGLVGLGLLGATRRRASRD